MDQNNTPNMAPMTPAPSQGGMGPMLGIIVIVLVLAAGALYMWYAKAKQMPAENTPKTTTVDQTGGPAAAASTDAESSIEADLQSTDTGNASGALQLQ